MSNDLSEINCTEETFYDLSKNLYMSIVKVKILMAFEF